jgi:hypothetical protein
MKFLSPYQTENVCTNLIILASQGEPCLMSMPRRFEVNLLGTVSVLFPFEVGPLLPYMMHPKVMNRRNVSRYGRQSVVNHLRV